VVRAGSIRFWISLAFLNSLLVLRLPGQLEWWTYLLPSIDVVALSLGWVFFAAWGIRVPRAVSYTLLVFFLASGLLRVADGVERGAYLKDFIPSLDLVLLLELPRLLHATLPLPELGLASVLCVVLLGAVSYSIARACEVARVELASPTLARGLCWVVGALACLASSGLPLPLFQASMLPRWATELERALELPQYRLRQRARIAKVGRALEARPHDLQTLHGQDVYVFLIESYGQSVLDRPELFGRVEPEYRRYEGELSAAGFQIASRVLDSPVYGGRSWLAQATLLSGVPIRDQLQLEQLREVQPRTIPQLFTAAGYRSVLIQPGTVRGTFERDWLHFEQRYVARDLDYQGPRFGWATMPDQFVLDAVGRRELSVARERPLFLCYALVSSHVRWSDLPPVVENWSTLGDGSLFNQLPSRHYDTSWLSLSGARTAYADAIVYDLAVLRRYLEEFVPGEALVLILGDHQPHTDITRKQPSPGVPVHVLSRSRSSVASFLARGYTPGMVASEALPHPGLDSLLPELVADFSRGAARSVH
jgi:hypothetical protein